LSETLRQTLGCLCWAWIGL